MTRRHTVRKVKAGDGERRKWPGYGILRRQYIYQRSLPAEISPNNHFRFPKRVMSVPGDPRTFSRKDMEMELNVRRGKA